MTRAEALVESTRLATTTGQDFRAYNLDEAWIVVEGWLADDLAAFYQAHPDGRMTYHLGRRDEGAEVRVVI